MLKLRAFEDAGDEGDAGAFHTVSGAQGRAEHEGLGVTVTPRHRARTMARASADALAALAAQCSPLPSATRGGLNEGR